MNPILEVLGYDSCLAGNHEGCELGPQWLRRSDLLRRQMAAAGLRLNWRDLRRPSAGTSVEAVAGLCREMTHWTRLLTSRGRPFACLGGDHSMAMGSWRGVLQALGRESLGLIWIDAHMDAHDYLSSPSGNLHGMPLAALLGEGDPLLRRIHGGAPWLDPQRLVLLGVRSFEPAERERLDRLGVQWLSVEQVRSGGGMARVVEAWAERFSAAGGRFGVSLDLDALDPVDAPAVGSPEPGGFSAAEMLQGLSGLGGHPGMVGLEIAEFSPLRDQQRCTERLIGQLLAACYASREKRSLGSESEGISASSSPTPNSSASS